MDMARISVNNLTFCYDGSFDNIFEGVSFSVDTDWKLGMIGRNGKGKTTFLNLLLGKYEYQGSISVPTYLDYFPYDVGTEEMHRPAAEFLDRLKPGCEQWRVLYELELLQADAGILYRAFETLSPGERTKVMLALLFSSEQDFLLVDEPTNHLDQESREIVKKYLASKSGFLLVSHDRDLLDACIDHVLVLNRKTIEVQRGNFSSWWENKKRNDQFSQAENEKHWKEIGKLKQASRQIARWAEKNEQTKIGFDPVKEHDRCMGTRAYIGAKTKKMQSRVKQMEKRIGKEIEAKEGLLQDIENPVDLKIMPQKHPKDILLHVRDYGLRYQDAEDMLFSGLSFDLRQGERIALHGKNGCGKSTLLKIILKKAEKESAEGILESGICESVSGLRISYVNQDTSSLKGSLQQFCEGRMLDRSLFLAILRQLDMERTQFGKPMEEYSEGQKKKVLLAASLLTPAHLYLWDEPLNYIDVFSRMQIEKLLLEYQPTMLFVEHDAYFRENIATATIAF